jgi:hypothetical protein
MLRTYQPQAGRVNEHCESLSTVILLYNLKTLTIVTEDMVLRPFTAVNLDHKMMGVGGDDRSLNIAHITVYTQFIVWHAYCDHFSQ